MNSAVIDLKATNNLTALGNNPYPGRGILVGIDEKGEYVVQIYWIMGRSPGSRNRVFVTEPEGVLRTQQADTSKNEDTSLTIYTAMASIQGIHAVSNGHQTEDAMKHGLKSDFFVNTWRYEPDAPNFTPRITAVVTIRPEIEYPYLVEFAVFKKSETDDRCVKVYKSFTGIPNGYGHCVTTYKGDGNPLPSFEGEPYLLPIRGTALDIAHTFWNALNKENKVSLAVKSINLRTGEMRIKVINKYSSVHPDPAI